MSKEKHGFGKFLLGAGIGVGLGMLFAPKSGKETRADLKAKMDDLLAKAKNLSKEDVKEAIEKKVDEIKKELKKLDKETVAEKMKDGAKKIKKKADELVDYAVLKGTPVIEAAAREVRESTIKALESMAKKLSESDSKEETPKKVTTKKKTASK